jgi:hypothetical protein
MSPLAQRSGRYDEASRDMKHPSVKRSEPQMRFFTPELYLRFNSKDEDVADRANEEWETALEAYGRELRKLRKSTSASVTALAKLDLHDAEWVGMEIGKNHSEWPKQLAIITLFKDNILYSLIYQLVHPVVHSAQKSAWPFSTKSKHWLYDEIETTKDGFLHRVLVSDGRILEIPFRSVNVNQVRLPGMAKRQRARQIA